MWAGGLSSSAVVGAVFLCLGHVHATRLSRAKEWDSCEHWTALRHPHRHRPIHLGLKNAAFRTSCVGARCPSLSLCLCRRRCCFRHFYAAWGLNKSIVDECLLGSDLSVFATRRDAQSGHIDIAIARVEQLSPLTFDEVAMQIKHSRIDVPQRRGGVSKDVVLV